MNDREFLIWLHARLETVHKESATMDYMHKLRAIIRATPAGRYTPSCATGNSLDELLQDMRREGK